MPTQPEIQPVVRTANVSNQRIITVEHPCVINDVDKGVKTLGGEHQIKRIFDESSSTLPIAVALRANDPFARKLPSRKSEVNHLLLRVNVPRRTGRKRKRGSDDEFLFHDKHDEHNQSERPHILDNINDTAGLLKILDGRSNIYDIDVLGNVNTTHRFRGLPDFQVVSQDSEMMKQVAKSLVEPTLEKIKTFSPNLSIQYQPEDIAGPPQFAAYDQYLYYMYSQNKANPNVSAPDGRPLSTNAFTPSRRVTVALAIDAETVPTGPVASLPLLNTTNRALQKAVATLQELLAKRPILTRRAAMNLCKIPPTADALFKNATEYVGYAFSSGPWKDTLIKFGIDPRTSPDYRIYQSLSFQLIPNSNSRKGTSSTTGNESKKWTRADQLNKQMRSIKGGKKKGTTTTTTINNEEETDQQPSNEHDTTDQTPEMNPTSNISTEKTRKKKKPSSDALSQSHIFTGSLSSTLNTKTWQVIDIQEEFIADIFKNSPVPSKPNLNEGWGWYTNGSICTARVIMRDMLTCMINSSSSSSSSTSSTINNDDNEREKPWLRYKHLYEKIIKAVPSNIDSDNIKSTYHYQSDDLNQSEIIKVGEMLTNIRSMAKGVKLDHGRRTVMTKKKASDDNGNNYGDDDNDSHGHEVGDDGNDDDHGNVDEDGTGDGDDDEGDDDEGQESNGSMVIDEDQSNDNDDDKEESNMNERSSCTSESAADQDTDERMTNVEQ